MAYNKKGSKRWISFSKTHKKIAFSTILLCLSILLIDVLIDIGQENRYNFFIYVLKYTVIFIASHLLSTFILRKNIDRYERKLNKIKEDNNQKSNILVKEIRYDLLTEILNKKGILEVITNLEKNKKNFTMFLIDIDDFKLINDLKGIVWSDLAIKEIATYLSALTFKYEVARTHQHKFMILSLQTFTEETLVQACNEILNNISSILHNKDNPYLLSVSMGVSHFNKDDKKIPDAITKAELALTHAKQSGKNKFIIFKDTYYDEKIKEILIMSSIKTALLKEELYLVYQPIMSLCRNSIYGVEALLRWEHSELGYIAPDKLVSLAEKTGDIHQITEFVVKQAFKQLKDWNDKGIDLKVFINVSPKNLTDVNFPCMLEKYKDIYQINPENICFEITESTKLDKYVSAKEVMYKIKELNYKIAIDDFGTGYATLSYIKDFPIDIVKLDKSFIKNIETQEEDRLFLKFISDIANSLKKDIIIEGIETKIQEQIVKQHEIKLAQGFYYANAKKPTELIDVFEKYGLVNKVN